MGWEELTAGYPVIVLEGCDGTGKSTLASLLATQHGYTVIRGRLDDGADLAGRYRAVLNQPGKLALDRSFVSELVYGPLRNGRSRLTADEAAQLAFAVADRGGVLVHLTAHPKALAWRLRARDGHAPTLDWIRSVCRGYRHVFAALDGAAPIVKVDTTADILKALPARAGHSDIRRNDRRPIVTDAHCTIQPASPHSWHAKKNAPPGGRHHGARACGRHPRNDIAGQRGQ